MHRHGNEGYTVVEAVMVVAIIGVLASAGLMSANRFASRESARTGITMVAGVLGEARDRAVKDGVPYLVVFEKEAFCNESGNRAPIARIVRDNDRSFDISAPDAIEPFELNGNVDCDVTAYGEATGSSDPFPNMPISHNDLAAELAPIVDELREAALAMGIGSPEEMMTDVSKMAAVMAAVDTTNLDPEIVSEINEVLSDLKVASNVVNGATFPIDAGSGNPMIAFTPRGVPVDPADPTEWGSGAGAFYLTNNRDAVYSAAVSPIGEITLTAYDPGTATWR